MADYYAVLKRTLSGFGEPSASLRSKIYDKARATIAKQLDATQPPLADEVKSAQLAQLDDAIARMEAEYGGPVADDFVGTPPPLPIGGGAFEPASDPEPNPQPEPIAVEPAAVEPVAVEPVAVEPVAVERTSIDPASVEAAPVEPIEPEPIVETSTPVVHEPVPAIEPTSTVEPVTDSPASDPLAEAYAAIDAARAQVEGTPDAAPAPPESNGDAIEFDPAVFDAAARSEPVARSESVAPPPAGSEPTASRNDAFDDPGANIREAAALGAGSAAVVTRPPRREKRRGGGVVWFLLLVAAIGLLFVFRAPLLAAVGVPTTSIDRFVAEIPVVGEYLVGEVDDPNDPTRPVPVPTIRITPDPEPADVEEGKDEQRLGPDAEPEAGTDVGALPPPTVPPIETPAADAPDTDTTTQVVPITPTEPEAAPAAPEVAVVEQPPVEPEATSEPATQPAAPAVAQSAILYEEGGGTRETRSDRGNVVWSVIRQSPGNGEPEEPAIQAVFDVPERELKATITLRRNTDKALAASHLMEVNFEPAAGFSGQNIDELLAVRLKPDERSQGSPLSIIPAKIAPGYFYVALDNLPAARERNVELLRSARWIDVPVEYVTGRRALVSLEKGVTGERVFSEAFTAWDAAAQ